MRNRVRRKKQRGAAMMETVLLLPLFLIFWFGIVDWGMTYYAHQTIVHNANLAARWAIVNGWDPDTIKNVVAYGKTTGSGPGMFGIDPATNVKVDLCWFEGSPPVEACYDSSAGKTGAEYDPSRRIQITVAGYTWRHFTPFFAGPYVGRTVVVSLPTEDLATP